MRSIGTKRGHKGAALSPRAPGYPARRHSIACYLFQASDTSAAWEAQVSNPPNRIEVIRPLIAEMLDAISAAAFSLTTSAGGALKAIITTPLLTIEEGIEAMKEAAGTAYRPLGR